jgi:opacity protein-like surface antigen
MKYLKISSLVLFLFLSLSVVQAQRGEMKAGVSYSIGIPTGSFKDIVPGTSYRGWQGTLLYGINDKISVGLGTGYQDYYHKNPRQLYKATDGSDISAVLTHSIQTIPILAQGKYNFSPEAAIQPYVALGVGGNLVMYRQLLGRFGDNEFKFGFAARPEGGVYVPFRKGREAGLTLGASYNFMPFKQDDFKNLNSIGVHAGITVPLRR